MGEEPEESSFIFVTAGGETVAAYRDGEDETDVGGTDGNER